MARETLSRASELFSRDSKPDTLDIRAMTTAQRSQDGKRQKYRMTVNKASAVLYGSKFNLSAGELEKLPSDQLFINDPRASSLAVDYTDEAFHCMPSCENFSAHTGICQILGNKSIKGGKHRLQVGDIIRFGSVGLLVSEIDTGNAGSSDQTLSSAEVSSLLQKHVSCDEDGQRDYDSGVDTDEEAVEQPSDTDTNRIESVGEIEISPSMCYVCYDEGSDDNPLIAPCKCTGDTKFIHVACLKRWNTGEDKNEICAVLQKNNSRACTICKAPYPASLRIESGKLISLLPDKLDAPSITLIVITRHSTSSMAINTKFQLSLASLIANGGKRPLLVGRSSQCDLILKYRTVSTVHAEIHYMDGEFYVQDVGSSNGTLRYIYKPVKLVFGQPLHLKFGRTIVSLKAKKRLRLAKLFSGFGTSSTPSRLTSTTSNP